MGKRVTTNEVLQQYQEHLCLEERSRGTVDKYSREIQGLAAWLAGAELTRERLAAWKEQLQQKQLKPATINAKLAAICSLLKFMGWQDCQVKFLKIQRRVFREKDRELTRAEYDKLLEAALKQGKRRLALLLEAICATGVRVSEVQYITVEAARCGRAEVAMKGKIRTILIPNKLCRKLLKYAKKEKTVSGKIFLTRNGTALSRKQFWAEMKSLCKAAHVAASKVFPHNLRHLFATVFYRACHDIVKLADVLGHSRIETTRIYLVTTGIEYARQLERLGLVH